jgi:hypothetical protein
MASPLHAVGVSYEGPNGDGVAAHLAAYDGIAAQLAACKAGLVRGCPSTMGTGNKEREEVQNIYFDSSPFDYLNLVSYKISLTFFQF